MLFECTISANISQNYSLFTRLRKDPSCSHPGNIQDLGTRIRKEIGESRISVSSGLLSLNPSIDIICIFGICYINNVKILCYRWYSCIQCSLLARLIIDYRYEVQHLSSFFVGVFHRILIAPHLLHSTYSGSTNYTAVAIREAETSG
ncbi:uncharacterized protein LOC125500018 [Athalia rosae]|uniref:uncharacterized protein LOC125500018 n=1 Tax=Athalia rosae TaxID=37344 RepID=UPI0020340760|nr:uncharacterized protein LOC125500018 [Athalia rosae]